jgi:hypothetical protein
MTDNYRRVLADSHRRVFRREGVFGTDLVEGIPHSNEEICNAHGIEAANRISIIDYQFTRARILDYSSSALIGRLKRSLEREFLRYPGTPADESIGHLGDFRIARRECETAERELLSGSLKRIGSGRFLFEEWLVNIEFRREVDLYSFSPYLSLRFGEVSLRPSLLFHLDLEGYLEFFDMESFGNRYRRFLQIMLGYFQELRVRV